MNWNNLKNWKWRWTIRNRVQLMLWMSLVGMMIIIGFTFYFLFEQSRINDEVNQVQATSQQAKTFEIQMLDAQIKEKEFLNHPSQSTAKKVKAIVSDVVKRSGKWKDKAQNKEVSKKFGDIQKSAKSYADAFNELVIMQNQIGFSNQDGLRALLSKHYASFQKIADSAHNPQLKQRLLALRLHQIQYIANPSEQQYKQFGTSAQDLQSWVSGSDIDSKKIRDLLTEMLPYTNSFDTVHKTYQAMATTETSFNKTADKVQNSVGAIVQQLEKKKQNLSDQQANLKHLLTVLLIIVSAIIVLLLAFFGIWLIRSITRSIESLKHGATIIGEGNLAYRVDLDTEDEIGDLAKTFNGMAEKMQGSMQKVLSAADRLSSSSQNLAAVSEETTAQANEVNEAILQVSAGAQNQAEHLEESTELISSVTTAVDNTASYGSQIATDSANAETEGKKGLETVNQLDDTSEQFIGLTTRLIEEVQKTSEQSKEINSIVQTIKEIAGNTDLLALNAAIESARAGEAGKGFAVVATEVRKLAERSKTEAQHIQRLVNTIGAQMGKLSEEADQLNEYREAQGTSVKQTKSAFEAIVANVNAINQRIKNTQEAIEQVASSNQNLSAKLEEVSAISEESAASAQQVSAASDHQKEAIEQVNQAAFDLQNIAIDLQQEVSLFQLTHEENLEDEAPGEEQISNEEAFQAEQEAAGTIEDDEEKNDSEEKA